MIDITSGFLCGASTTSQCDLVLSSHSSEKSSEGLSMRCNANEHITISITGGFEDSKKDLPVSASRLRDSEGRGGKAPLAMSRNDSDAQGSDVRST